MNKEKKTDRRTLYTQSVVKNAFLELIRDHSYDRINVTMICRKADISRATFYLHFDNIDDVLDHVLDDALLFSGEQGSTTIDAVDLLSGDDPDLFSLPDPLLPPCQRIANSDLYHALFMDPLLSDHIIQRIEQHERKFTVSTLMRRCGVSEKEAELIFRFILHGSFAVNRSLHWQKNDRWFRMQKLLAYFVAGGIQNIHEEKASAPPDSSLPPDEPHQE